MCWVCVCVCVYAYTHRYIFISENSTYSFRRFLDPLKYNPRSRLLGNKSFKMAFFYYTHTHTHTHTHIYVMSWVGEKGVC